MLQREQLVFESWEQVVYSFDRLAKCFWHGICSSRWCNDYHFFAYELHSCIVHIISHRDESCDQKFYDAASSRWYFFKVATWLWKTLLLLTQYIQPIVLTNETIDCISKLAVYDWLCASIMLQYFSSSLSHTQLWCL